MDILNILSAIVGVISLICAIIQLFTPSKKETPNCTQQQVTTVNGDQNVITQNGNATVCQSKTIINNNYQQVSVSASDKSNEETFGVIVILLFVICGLRNSLMRASYIELLLTVVINMVLVILQKRIPIVHIYKARFSQIAMTAAPAIAFALLTAQTHMQLDSEANPLAIGVFALAAFGTALSLLLPNVFILGRSLLRAYFRKGFLSERFNNRVVFILRYLWPVMLANIYYQNILIAAKSQKCSKKDSSIH